MHFAPRCSIGRCKENVGFSHFVSVGNMLDVGIGDLIDYFAMDRWTESIILYVESITEAREFMSAARAFARNKPIIAYKAGRFAESAQAAASHTGAMAGVDAVYEAAFARAGIVRVFEVDDMFDCAELLARQKTPEGAAAGDRHQCRWSGRDGDRCACWSIGGQLAKLSEATRSKAQPRAARRLVARQSRRRAGRRDARAICQCRRSRAGGQRRRRRIGRSHAASDDRPDGLREAVIEVAKKSQSRCYVLDGRTDDGRGQSRLFNEAGIPTYSSPEKAVRAFMHLVSYARNREILYETPRDIPVEFPLDRGRLRAVFDTILSEGHDVLTRKHIQSVAGSIRDPGDQAVCGPLRRRRSSVGSPHRLPGRHESSVAPDHPQDRCRRRGIESGQ